MKLALFSLIRNEIDIIHLFLNHIDSLFDVVYLLDHRSTDGTSDILKNATSSNPNWHYVFVDTSGYFQDKYPILLMDEIFEQDVDALFFLDCDEFILVKSREQLEKSIYSIIDDSNLGYFKWINAIPEFVNENFWSRESGFWQIKSKPKYKKIVLTKKAFEKQSGEVLLTRGYHQAFDGHGNSLPMEYIGDYVHIPIRSKNQLVKKIFTHTVSKYAIRQKKEGLSFHIFDILEQLAKKEITDDFIKGCVFIYQDEKEIRPIKNEDFVKSLDYTYTSLKEMNIPISNIYHFDSCKFEFNLMSIMANLLLDWREDYGENIYYDREKNTILSSESNFNNELSKKHEEKILLLEEQVNSRNKEILYLKEELLNINQQLAKIKSSKSWRTVEFMKKIRRIFPVFIT